MRGLAAGFAVFSIAGAWKMILRLMAVYPKGILEPVREVNSTRRTAPRGRMRPGLDVVVLAGVDEVLLVVRRR